MPNLSTSYLFLAISCKEIRRKKGHIGQGVLQCTEFIVMMLLALSDILSLSCDVWPVDRAGKTGRNWQSAARTAFASRAVGKTGPVGNAKLLPGWGGEQRLVAGGLLPPHFKTNGYVLGAYRPPPF